VEEFDRPPGVYAAAPRPVPEIALVAAIGLMCGIVGRSYNVSGTGLNQYVLLLAPTGTGKEAIASGIEKLMKAVERTVPASSDFIGPAEIASSPALTKYLSRTPCFVSVLGEFGLTLQEMSMPRAPGYLVSLKRLMLDLYNKSGEGSQLRPRIYSDREKNTDTVSSPAFSLVGESTPLRFYQALSEDMIEEGLLPRILTIEYTGPRPPLNEERINDPSFHLVDQLGALCTHSLMLNSQNKTINVRFDERAIAVFKAFNDYCDKKINSSQSELTRQLWNRAHIKAMKLAALVAIGINTYKPVIDEMAANWAIDIETAGVRNILSRFESGQVGQQSLSETAQQMKVRSVVRDWITRSWSELARYKIGTEAMSQSGVVPYSYMSKRLTNDAAFKDGRGGATQTIKRAIDELCKGGELMKFEPQDALKKFNTRAELYAVTDAKRIVSEGRTSNRQPEASDS
jgi:hypothetical protein